MTGMNAAEDLLSCRNVSMRFGGLWALRDVTLRFGGDRIYGLIGPNGAGKTTLVNVLSGRLRPTAGSIHFEGRDITALSPATRARLGISRSFQITQIFAGFTVRENVELALQPFAFRVQPFWRSAARYGQLREQADRILEAFDLTGHANTLVDRLSHGDQRGLDLALATVSQPKVLLLDEPLAGVGQHEVAGAVRRIRSVVRGRTVILIDHNMGAIMEISDHVVVMTDGGVLASGSPSEVQQDARVRAAYLGDEVVVA